MVLFAFLPAVTTFKVIYTLLDLFHLTAASTAAEVNK